MSMLAALHRATHPERHHGLEARDNDESRWAVSDAIVAAREDFNARCRTPDGYRALVEQNLIPMSVFVQHAVRAAVPQHLRKEDEPDMKTPPAPAPTAVGRAAPSSSPARSAPPAANSEEAWRAEYRASAALQAEFEPAGGEEIYVAYARGVAQHRSLLASKGIGVDLHAVREKAKAKFAADPQIRAEFGTSSAYEAYAVDVMTGRARSARKDLREEFS